MTKTNHPMMAVLRWPALQAPMRAATFTVFLLCNRSAAAE
jgi:hypothetical protein